jgi:nitrite reductase (NADH) large subunit
LLGVEVSSLGEFQDAGDVLVHKTDASHRELVLRRGRLVGAIIVGPNPELGRLQAAVESRRRVWPSRRERFLRIGRLWPDETPSHPLLWPADAMVCNCQGVTRGTLSAACLRGCRTVEELASATGASTVCGTCRPLVAQIAGEGAIAAVPVPGRRAVAVTAALALVGAFAVATLPPLSVGESVEFRRAYEVVVGEPLWRQITGFTVAGLAAASLLLSVRKRLRRFALGNFGWWRALHTSLGLAGITVLGLHTGFSLGNNFNRVLMLDFLALVTLGTCAGFVTAAEARLDPRTASRLRSFWTWAHIIAVWPLPALLIFHVIAAYYF